MCLRIAKSSGSFSLLLGTWGDISSPDFIFEFATWSVGHPARVSSLACAASSEPSVFRARWCAASGHPGEPRARSRKCEKRGARKRRSLMQGRRIALVCCPPQPGLGVDTNRSSQPETTGRWRW